MVNRFGACVLSYAIFIAASFSIAISTTAAEADRARIFEFNPDGTNRKVYAWGIRNAVGIAFRPDSHELWMSTNERDEVDEYLPPEYISSVRSGGVYGWPWFYIGNHTDRRHKG